MKLLPVDVLLQELTRRASKTGDFAKLLADLHPKQRAFVEDKSRQKAALCSRRAGKSWGIAAWLIEGGLTDPGGLSVYIARSKGDARLIIWNDVLEVMSKKYGLGLRLREIDNQLMVELPNQHRIWLAGCKDSSEIGKFRGKKYRRACVDEAQELAFLQELIAASVQPALVDKKGELCIAGTPGPIPGGFFYEKTTGDGSPQWPTHEWTILDNPYIQDAEEELALLRNSYGWTTDHPTYQREWLGKWVRDEGALVYLYSAAKNAFTELPEGDYSYALGVDIGFTDSTAIVVAAVRAGHPEVYIVEAWKREGLIPSAVAAHVARFIEQYKPLRVVVDEGGAGKGYAEEMRQRYNIPCEAAEKSKKRAFQEIVGGDLKAGVVKVDPWKCGALLDEIAILQWRADKLAEDERFENHAADAFLYVVRSLRAWYRPEREPPAPGTPAALLAEQKRIKEETRRRVQKDSVKRWPHKGRWKFAQRILDQVANLVTHLCQWHRLAQGGFARTLTV